MTDPYNLYTAIVTAYPIQANKEGRYGWVEVLRLPCVGIPPLSHQRKPPFPLSSNTTASQALPSPSVPPPAHLASCCHAVCACTHAPYILALTSLSSSLLPPSTYSSLHPHSTSPLFNPPNLFRLVLAIAIVCLHK